MNPTRPFARHQGLLAMLLPLLLMTLSSPSWALSPQTEQEIDQLLAYISAADCEFERNGDSVSPAKAHSHIEMKYGNTRKYIKTSEDFIKYAASESSWTGRPYKVRCNGVELTTAVWLQAELQRLRNSQTATTKSSE